MFQNKPTLSPTGSYANPTTSEFMYSYNSRVVVDESVVTKKNKIFLLSKLTRLLMAL
jgi:hypothetical protein